MSWVQDVFDFDLKVEQRALECQVGALGFIPGEYVYDPTDCWWRRYYP